LNDNLDLDQKSVVVVSSYTSIYDFCFLPLRSFYASFVETENKINWRLNWEVLILEAMPKEEVIDIFVFLNSYICTGVPRFQRCFDPIL